MFSKTLLILSFVSVAFANVYVTAPVAGTTYTAGNDSLVSWISTQDNTTSPTLEEFGPAIVSIYVGNARQQTRLQVINSNVDVSKETNFRFRPEPSIGPNSNEYFVRFESISGKERNTSFPFMAFSAKFTLTGMTGEFNTSVREQIAGQSTAPLAIPSTTSGTSGTATSTPSLTASSASKTSTTSASARPSSGAMGLKAGWAGMVFGAVVGVTMF